MVDEGRASMSPEDQKLSDQVVAMCHRMVDSARAGKQVVMWELDAPLDFVELVAKHALEVSISWRSDRQPDDPEALERARIDPYFGERFLEQLKDLVLGMPKRPPKAPSI